MLQRATIAIAWALSGLLALHALPAAWANTSVRLVVLIVIDQMRADVFDRYGEAFDRNGGFERLRRSALDFENCRYGHLCTTTAPGHATIATGATPAVHGIVGNRWFDRARGRRVYCLSGPRGLGFLEAETIADVFEEQTGGRARIVAVSWKDRAAVLLGGRSPDRLAWFDRWRKQVVIRGGKEPAWALIAASRARLRRRFGSVWRRALPARFYPEVDLRPGERGPFGLGIRFPHPLDGGSWRLGPAFFDAVALTPIPDEETLALALELSDLEGLGEDETPDLLAISFSSSDLVGHWFGPMSQEARDVYVRLDRLLARLIAHFEAKVGGDRLALVLVGDHGGTPIPGAGVAERGVEAAFGRVAIVRLLRVAAEAATKATGRSSAIEAFCPPHLYLKPHARSLRVKRAVAAAIDRLRGVRARADSDLLHGAKSAPEQAARAALYRGRSGDVLVWLEPNYAWAPGEPSHHGRPSEDDMRVPLFVRLPGLQPRTLERPCRVRDLAPSLLRALGMRAPAGCEGSVLPEVLGR